MSFQLDTSQLFRDIFIRVFITSRREIQKIEQVTSQTVAPSKKRNVIVNSNDRNPMNTNDPNGIQECSRLGMHEKRREQTAQPTTDSFPQQLTGGWRLQ